MNNAFRYLLVATLIFPHCCSLATAEEITPSKGVAKPNGIDRSGIGCVDKEGLNSKLTPVDIYKGIASCIEQEKFEPGVFMYAMAGAYGRFDSLRVVDISAHQVTKILPMVTFDSLNKEKVSAFKAQIGQILGNDSKRAKYCVEIESIGPPDYFPSYMVQHGLGAFTKAKSMENALTSPFDSQTAWKQAVNGYLQCPIAK